MTFGDALDQSIEKATLPSGPQTLTLDDAFNQSIEKVALQSGLQTLTVGARRRATTCKAEQAVVEGGCTCCFRRHAGTECGKPVVCDAMIVLCAMVLDCQTAAAPKKLRAMAIGPPTRRHRRGLDTGRGRRLASLGVYFGPGTCIGEAALPGPGALHESDSGDASESEPEVDTLWECYEAASRTYQAPSSKTGQKDQTIQAQPQLEGAEGGRPAQARARSALDDPELDWADEEEDCSGAVAPDREGQEAECNNDDMLETQATEEQKGKLARRANKAARTS